MEGRIRTTGKIIGPILQWMGPPIRVVQNGEWIFFESSWPPAVLKLSQKAVGGKLSRELCISADVARYIKQSDVVEISDDYVLTINGITRIRLYEDKCEPLRPPQFEPYAVAAVSKYHFDTMMERLLRIRPHDIEVSADEKRITMKAYRGEALAEATIPATVRRPLEPLEPIYVKDEFFRGVKALPLAGKVEIALGGEPAKAAGEVRYKASVVQIRAVGEGEYTAWWV